MLVMSRVQLTNPRGNQACLLTPLPFTIRNHRPPKEDQDMSISSVYTLTNIRTYLCLYIKYGRFYIFISKGSYLIFLFSSCLLSQALGSIGLNQGADSFLLKSDATGRNVHLEI